MTSSASSTPPSITPTVATGWTIATHRPAGLEHARRLADGAGRVLDVQERHEGHDQIRRAVVERQRGRVRHAVVGVGVGLGGVPDQRGRGIERDDSVSALAQQAGEPSLAAADVDCEPARARQQVEERGRVPAERDVAVRGERDPLLGHRLPAVRHARPARSRNRSTSRGERSRTTE
jgi:hypothetical protein